MPLLNVARINATASLSHSAPNLAFFPHSFDLVIWPRSLSSLSLIRRGCPLFFVVAPCLPALLSCCTYSIMAEKILSLSVSASSSGALFASSTFPVLQIEEQVGITDEGTTQATDVMKLSSEVQTQPAFSCTGIE